MEHCFQSRLGMYEIAEELDKQLDSDIIMWHEGWVGRKRPRDMRC
jgi:hypothetical protein